jgi:uncharacterized membrane protein YdbT with pleckstrin-like domain
MNGATRRPNSFDLKSKYPLSIRFFVLNLLPWFAGIVSGVGIVYLSDIEDKLFGVPFAMFDAWNLPGIVFLAVALCMCAIGCISVRMKLASRTYAIRRNHLDLGSGVIVKRYRSIPLRSVTDVRLRASFLSLLFGLRQIEIETASSRGSESVVIEGVGPRTALALREEILRYIDSSQISLEFERAESVEHFDTFGPDPKNHSWINPHTFVSSKVA